MASRFLTPVPAARGWLSDPVFQLQREIDRVFDDVFSGTGNGGRSGGAALMSTPRIDVHEAEGELRVHADLPGVSPSDLDVRVEGDVLTIRGERKSRNERNEQNYHVMERSHGRFQRSIQLPFTPDPQDVQAEVREGVLEIRIPKREPQERSRRIEVRGGNESQGPAGAASQGAAASGARGSVASAIGGDAGPGASGGSGASSSGGQGPGGTSSVTPGTGAGAQGGEGGGLAGVAGGPTAAPVGTSGAGR